MVSAALRVFLVLLRTASRAALHAKKMHMPKDGTLGRSAKLMRMPAKQPLASASIHWTHADKQAVGWIFFLTKTLDGFTASSYCLLLAVDGAYTKERCNFAILILPYSRATFPTACKYD
jgi:hypothetical protein